MPGLSMVEQQVVQAGQSVAGSLAALVAVRCSQILSTASAVAALAFDALQATV